MAKEQKALLEGAGKGFDAIFQEYRSSGKPIAMLPHMWHGKVLEDLNQRLDAIDVYDEVLGLTPDAGRKRPRKTPTSRRSLRQAFLFRLRMVASDEEVETKDMIAEGQKFLDDYKGLANGRSPTRASAWRWSRPSSTAGRKSPDSQRTTKIYREVSQTLLAVGKIDSTYKQEALLLRRDAMAKQGATGAITADDRLALVDEAMAQQNWAEAEKLCREVVAQATEKKEAKRLTDAKARLAEILYQVAGSGTTRPARWRRCSPRPRCARRAIPRRKSHAERHGAGGVCLAELVHRSQGSESQGHGAQAARRAGPLHDRHIGRTAPPAMKPAWPWPSRT